jgi:hypothetical protein
MDYENIESYLNDCQEELNEQKEEEINNWDE